MEENKTNTTDQTTYWVLQETSSLYWVFCLHSQLPNTVFTVDTKTFDAALHYTKIARHLAMGIVWVHGVHNVQQNTLEEARNLMHLSHEANVKIQVGHVERFNPAYVAAIPFFSQPMFIECHRLAEFNPRGTDGSVVLDLMIHDIDIILSVVKSRIKKISASGVAVISDTHDITNARLEFENGAVANLTASRISLKNMRKSRFFQKDAYISVDFLTKELEVVRMQDVIGEADPFDIVLDLGPNKAPKKIFIDKPELQEINAIKEELKSFYDAITQNVSPKVTVEDGCAAMEVAIEIIEKLKQNQIHF